MAREFDLGLVKGDPFTYEDFTPEQLEALTGPQGPAGTQGPPGADGADGAPGQDGQDGVSPVITGSKSGKVTTLTIIDRDHPSPGAVLATINDGADGSSTGDMLKATYDANDNGIVDNSEALDGHNAAYFATAAALGSHTGNSDIHVTASDKTSWSGKQDAISDLSDIRSGAEAGATAYQKPGTGVPSSDMSSAVQASLALADSAYQKPDGGIPAADMTAAVQTSLALADNTLQIRGNIATASEDLRTLAPGIYQIIGIAHPDFPETEQLYGTLIQYPGTYKGQLIVAGVAGVCGIYSRRYLTASSTFTPWTAIPTALEQLSDDATHRLVTDAEKATWSAKQDAISDLAAIRSGAAAGATAYQKPSGGISKNDLASAVQTSLGEADSAYQKPSGGIPSTDMAAAVQASLALADTALQSYTETDPTVPAWAKADNKPSYTYSEVGAEQSGAVNTHNSDASAHSSLFGSKLDVAQGVAHAGKFLVVGSDGNITKVTLGAWSGGSY